MQNTLTKIKPSTEKPFDLEFLMNGMSPDEIFALGRKNLCMKKYEGDELILPTALAKLRENSKRSGSEHVLFFRE